MMKQNRFRPMVYKVKSSDGSKEYLVSHTRENKISCTCNDWVYRSKKPDGYAKGGYKCKHCREVLASLEAREQVYQDGKE